MKTKDRKKRIQRYGKSLDLAPIIEQYSYYVSDKHKRLKQVQPLEVKYQGVALKHTVDENTKLKGALEQVKTYVNDVSSTLTSILIDYGCNTSQIDLKPLVDDILTLNIIHPDKEYIGFDIKDGYIVGLGYDVIIEKIELPDDVFNGYWTYNDKLVLDEVKFKELWNVVL